jgi:endothelin-converting enzyme
MLDIDSLFDVYIEGDVKVAPDVQHLWLSQPDLGLPEKSYYKDEDVLEVYQDVVSSTLADIYGELQGDGAAPAGSFDKLAEELIGFEKKVAKFSLDKSVARLHPGREAF